MPLPLRVLMGAVLLGAVVVGCEAPAPSPLGGTQRPTPNGPGGAGTDDGTNPTTDPPGPGPDDLASSKSSAILVDLGPVTTGKTVDLEVPKGALGFNVIVTSGGAGTMGIEKIQNPTGSVVQDAFIPKNGKSPNGKGLEGIGSASVPQNDLPDSIPVPGKWKVTFAGDGTNAHAQARIQTTSDGAFHGGVLDLHLYIPVGLRVFEKASATSHVVDTKSASTDPDLVERVNIFFQAIDVGFGIGRGKVTFHEAPTQFTIVNDDPTFYAATAISKGQPSDEQSFHMVLTNDLYAGDYAGYSPGIPGAASRTGTAMSGVVVALYASTDPGWDGFTWAHEMGHFIGLQHTTEQGATEFDLLNDTPQCATDPTVDCVDQPNLMSTIWPDVVPSRTVTKGQQAVFRGSPIYRARASAERSAAIAVAAHEVRCHARGTDESALATQSKVTSLRPHPSTNTSAVHQRHPTTRTERWLAGSLCGRSHQTHPSIDALVAIEGVAKTRAELEAITHDATLPGVFRTKATRMLGQLGSHK